MTTQSPVRLEAALKVTGQAVYPAETPAEGMLHAALVESPVAAGEVRAVDAHAARRMAGVADVVSYAETAVLAPSRVTSLIREPVIHFAGQPVALVAAETLLQARHAARAVQVDIAAHPTVTNLDQALDQAYAPAMNGRIPLDSQRGDVATGLADAALVVRQRYETAANNHHPMEPHAVVCAWQDGKATTHTTTQAVFSTRYIMARAFQVPLEDVRVITRFVSGDSSTSN